METSLNLIPLSLTSVPPTTNGIGFEFRFKFSSHLLMRDLAPLRLNRFNFNHYHRNKLIQHLPNSLSQIKPVSLSMADVAEKRENQPPPAKVEERENERVKQPPSPPEKPEAGDCCGSGCVRCVWDVYYDELESYNQLLKEFNDSQSQTPPKS